MISKWLLIAQIISWAFEKESVRVFHLGLPTKVSNPFIEKKKDTELKGARKLGHTFVCTQHFWFQDFLRRKTSQTTHESKQSEAPFPQGGHPGCALSTCQKEHGDPDATYFINRWNKMSSDSIC